jgi:hypothetical protein
MATTTPKMLAAAFRDHANAQLAHDRLLRLGYANDEINVLMSETTRTKFYTTHEGPQRTGTAVAEGMGIGGAIGTAVGATLGAIVAIGTSIAVPGLGLIVAGPLVAGLAGAGAGAVTGGVLGGLIGLGIPESNARAYEVVLREGGVILGVVPHSNDDAHRIRQDFEELNGENICWC